jgi:hypothetical protein
MGFIPGNEATYDQECPWHGVYHHHNAHGDPGCPDCGWSEDDLGEQPSPRFNASLGAALAVAAASGRDRLAEQYSDYNPDDSPVLRAAKALAKFTPRQLCAAMCSLDEDETLGIAAWLSQTLKHVRETAAVAEGVA